MERKKTRCSKLACTCGEGKKDSTAFITGSIVKRTELADISSCVVKSVSGRAYAKYEKRIVEHDVLSRASRKNNIRK